MNPLTRLDSRATSYTDSGLLDGAIWYYTVTAQGLPGAGTASAPVSATTYTALDNAAARQFRADRAYRQRREFGGF